MTLIPRGISLQSYLLLLVLWASVILTAAGCSRAGPERASVFGSITYDGEPLKEGAITFIPERPNQGPTAGGDILDGRYNLDASKGPVLGLHRVEIRGAIRTGRTIADPRMPTKKIDEILNVPSRYHSESKFIRDIMPGRNNFDFQLHSK